MRGDQRRSEELFSYVRSEERVPIAEKPPTASNLPGKVTTRWIKRQAMVGPNFKRMDRSPEKSASITVTIQPSRLADGEFFSSLLMLCVLPTAILDGVTPALKAARTAFNFPCVKGTAAATSTPCLLETGVSFLPRRFRSVMAADSNWSSSWSLRCLIAFGKSAGRIWREAALGDPIDSEGCE
jgi:hypothetical protein